jgi:hypothetical protein
MSPVNERIRAARSRFVALIAASATALGVITATAMPVRAEVDHRDLTKLLLGVAIAAIIANELSKKNDDDPEPPVVVGPGTHGGGQGRIPGACAIEVTGLRHDRVGYTGSCLASYGFRNLPQYCAVHARVYGRPDRLYPASCLRDAGYRLGRR